jgi:hypothetical protein
MEKISIKTPATEYDAVVETANTVFEDLNQTALDFGECATLIVDTAQYKRAYSLYFNLPLTVQATIENIENGHLENVPLYSTTSKTTEDEVTVCYENGTSIVFDRSTYLDKKDELATYLGALNVLKTICKVPA